MDDVYIFF